jgi:hypothetical protein
MKYRGGEGKIYFNARYYDPVTGRFLTEDPSRKGVNWYAYCENNPVNMVDPTGEQSKETEAIKADIARMQSNIAAFKEKISPTPLVPPERIPVMSANTSQRTTGSFPKVIYEGGVRGQNAFGEYVMNSYKVGLDTRPGNFNLIASAKSFVEQQKAVFGYSDAYAAFQTSQTLGASEAFIGIRDNMVVGAAANLTLASIAGSVQPTILGYGLKIGAAVNLGAGAKVEFGSTTDITINAILGITISVEAVGPNAKR